jgi:hypothetical protein
MADITVTSAAIPWSTAQGIFLQRTGNCGPIAAIIQRIGRLRKGSKPRPRDEDRSATSRPGFAAWAREGSASVLSVIWSVEALVCVVEFPLFVGVRENSSKKGG